MSNIRPLEQTLAGNLSFNKARIKLIAGFLIALLQVKTVNLTEIATAFPGKAKEESNYKRLQRFFRFFELPYALIADLVVKLLGVPGPSSTAQAKYQGWPLTSPRCAKQPPVRTCGLTPKRASSINTSSPGHSGHSRNGALISSSYPPGALLSAGGFCLQKLSTNQDER